jgi:uncharacterized protein
MKKSHERIIVEKTAEFARSYLEAESSGHDWWHAYRVYQNAILIAKAEKADHFIVSVAALLHDIADYKLHNGDTEIGPRIAAEWLQKNEVEAERIQQVCDIIRDLSFKGAGVTTSMKTVEGKIVQDADRLEAIGAVGVARAFAYGGYKNRPLYDPEVKPIVHTSFEEYKKNTSPTINHFYEKLLLLRERMNTQAAQKMAIKRHNFMVDFLNTFFEESGVLMPRLLKVDLIANTHEHCRKNFIVKG